MQLNTGARLGRLLPVGVATHSTTPRQDSVPPRGGQDRWVCRTALRRGERWKRRCRSVIMRPKANHRYRQLDVTCATDGTTHGFGMDLQDCSKRPPPACVMAAAIETSRPILVMTLSIRGEPGFNQSTRTQRAAK